MALHRPQRAGGIATPRLNLVLFLYGLLTTGMLIHSSFKGAPKAAGGGERAASEDKLLARIDQTLGAVDSLVKNLPAQGGAAAAVAAKPQDCPVCPKAAAAAAGGSGKQDSPTEVYLPPINLLDIFDKPQALSSVSSTAFMAYRCVPPLRETVKGATDEQVQALQATVLKEILELVAEAKGGGATAASLSPSDTMLQALGVEASGVNAPAFLKARATISDLAVSYALHVDGRAMCCAAAASSEVLSVEQVGAKKCRPREGTDCVGFLSAGYISQSIEGIAATIALRGWCSDPPEYDEGYANHMAKAKMMNETWKLFNVPTLEQDAIIQMFQLLYEARTVFLRQHWLGVVAMQNPFDAWSIQDIIYTIKPDVIVETGTANGGSAIMWASILHLMDHPGRVVTLDLAEPTEITWAQKRDNPRENALWKKYVTFIRGSTLDPATVKQVKEITATAKTVFVMLDSNHETNHVRQEIALYCPLTTVGSYCLVQDGKLSRIGWHGPYPAITEWLAANPNFVADRDRELLFTDHPSGYMKRVS